MELKINSAIKSQTKVSYAIESAGPLPYDIDCGEGIKISLCSGLSAASTSAGENL